MTKEKMQQVVKDILLNPKGYGLTIYMYLKNGENQSRLKKLKATDELISSIKGIVSEEIKRIYLDPEVEYDISDNIADNKKALYKIIQDEDYQPFQFLNDNSNSVEVYKEQDKGSLIGFFIKVNLNDRYFWAYQHIYPMTRINRSKNIRAVFNIDSYDIFEKDILQFSSRIDFLVLENSIIASNIRVLQKYYGFEKFIRAGAQKTIESIKEMDIVSDINKFIAFEGKSKLTNAKKLLKAKNSPVLKMDKNKLITSIKKHARYSKMFEFDDNDRINITSQTGAASFIKMINDDYVKSELTGQEYDSSSKALLDPIK